MKEREFEEFVLEQVRRNVTIYNVGEKVFYLCAVACLVMMVIAVCMHKDSSVILAGIPMILGFLATGAGYRSQTRVHRYAAEEMAEALENESFCFPDDYTRKTGSIRQQACRTLKSTRGLILSYGIIALMCWAGSIVLFYVSTLESGGAHWGLLLLGVILVLMALPLTILTIRSIRDLPMARRYQVMLDENDGVE